MTFEELNLSAPLLRAVQEAGYETPSPIQAAAIPPVLSGRDLMGCASPFSLFYNSCRQSSGCTIV